MSEELKKRWITAITSLTVVAVALFVKVSTIFYIVVLIITGLSIWECCRLLDLDSSYTAVNLISSILFISAVLFLSPPGMIAAAFIPLAFMGIKVYTETEANLVGVFPFYYITFPFSWALYLKLKGKILFLIAIAIAVWAGDAGAYFIGKKWGNKKLHPISPKKTVEGALGGLIVGGLLSSLFMIFIGWSVLKALICGLTLNLAGQIGDLFESYLKRKAQVKDSGHIFPGHGGALDRVDSLIFALFLSGLFKV